MTAAIKVLVTGRDGQLAQALAERAAANRCFDIIRIGRPDLDLERPTGFQDLIQKWAPDVVVSAAAYTAVDLAEDQPNEAHAINAVAPGRLAAAARTVGAPIIHISTDYVFDGSKAEPYTEADAINPLNVYGRTKLEGELRVAARNPDHIVLRTSWVYSPFGKNFVRTMLDLARSRDTLNVISDQHGSPTCALDLADAIIHIVMRWKTAPAAGFGQVYHCAGHGEASWYDLAHHTFGASHRLGGPFAEVAAIKASSWPAKAVRPMNSRLNCQKFATDFGWQAPDWQNSVDHVVGRLLAAQAETTK
jgi:dTDP-4-dehydrorhamnose reductase